LIRWLFFRLPGQYRDVVITRTSLEEIVFLGETNLLGLDPHLVFFLLVFLGLLLSDTLYPIILILLLFLMLKDEETLADLDGSFNVPLVLQARLHDYRPHVVNLGK